MKIRHHGFTCPKCGRHTWSTNTLDNTGHCTANEYVGNKCTFRWDRANPAEEAAVNYDQTIEQWMTPRKWWIEEFYPESECWVVADTCCLRADAREQMKLLKATSPDRKFRVRKHVEG